MLRVLTNLNLLNRQDFTGSTSLIASGVTGTWVKQETGTVDYVTTSGEYAVGPVWTESYRDGTVGSWSPDVGITGNLTIIWGSFRALTDQFTGAPAVGNALAVLDDGTLGVGTANSDYIVAYCTKASHSITHLGSTHTVIEFTTV